jgi:hypothetical protein
MELILDSLLNGFLESRTESLQHDRLRDGEQQLVLGLLELDVEILDIDLLEVSFA